MCAADLRAVLRQALVFRLLYAHKWITEGLGPDAKHAPNITECRREAYILDYRDAKVNLRTTKGAVDSMRIVALLVCMSS